MRVDAMNNNGMEYKKVENVEVVRSTQQVKAQIDNGNKKKNKEFNGEKQLMKEIQKMNSDLPFRNTSLKFAIHDKTNEIMVKVINDDTHEVIREIPSEKVLDMVAAVLERTGLILDTKA
ncbi:MAG: flagellar protein FlaG [Anaeromicrobium sp.]|jgi:flagellar protein FlaG|uniref:flagellar protein FlaG n=1 Tax=Anaeromicrobium sp. TaxID=1929132 RepID=UPI0025E1E2C6|nr:flagellar protein FlaG [Anaeromicrobium sp.]MCT4592706.1 flagellar protein FlaG [Anaeromicrobium sp.]